MLEKVTKIGFYFYIFLSVFEFALTYESGSLLKLYGFLLMGCWVVLFIRNKLTLGKYLISLMFFMLWMSLTLFWSPNWDFGLYYIMSMGNMVVLTLIASTLAWDENDVSILFTTFQLGALIFSMLIVFNSNLYYEGSYRLTILLFGSKLDPNNIAGLLIPGILISFYFLINTKKILLSTSTFLCSIFALANTGSRGGMLAILIGLFILFLQKISLRLPGRSMNGIKGIVIFAALIILFFQFLFPLIEEPLWDRFNLANAIKDRGSNRIDLWQKGIDIFLANPLGGIGIGGYVKLTDKGLHNQFLIVLVEGGLIGFVLFVFALSDIYRMVRVYNLKLLQAILLTIMVVIFFLDAYNKKFFWNGILLAVIMIQAKRERDKLKFDGTSPKDNYYLDKS